MTSPHFVMRTVLVSPQTDARLRALSIKENRSKGEIIRGFLEAGLAAVDKKSLAPRARPRPRAKARA